MTAALNLVGASPNKIKKVWEIKKVGVFVHGDGPCSSPPSSCQEEIPPGVRF